MDQIKVDLLDDVIEDAFKTEPMQQTPPAFTRLIMGQIQMEMVSGFQVFSLLDIILSLGAAITFGLVVSLPLLLPEQIRPYLQWLIQWIFYALEKSSQTWPLILGVGMGIVLVGLLLFAFYKEVFLSGFVKKQPPKPEKIS